MINQEEQQLLALLKASLTKKIETLSKRRYGYFWQSKPETYASIYRDEAKRISLMGRYEQDRQSAWGLKLWFGVKYWLNGGHGFANYCSYQTASKELSQLRALNQASQAKQGGKKSLYQAKRATRDVSSGLAVLPEIKAKSLSGYLSWFVARIIAKPKLLSESVSHYKAALGVRKRRKLAASPKSTNKQTITPAGNIPRQRRVFSPKRSHQVETVQPPKAKPKPSPMELAASLDTRYQQIMAEVEGLYEALDKEWNLTQVSGQDYYDKSKKLYKQGGLALHPDRHPGLRETKYQDKPDGYFKAFSAKIEKIRQLIDSKLTQGVALYTDADYERMFRKLDELQKESEASCKEILEKSRAHHEEISGKIVALTEQVERNGAKDAEQMALMKAEVDEAHAKQLRRTAKMSAAITVMHREVTHYNEALDSCAEGVRENRAEIGKVREELKATNANLDKANANLDEANANLDKANANLDKANAMHQETNGKLDYCISMLRICLTSIEENDMQSQKSQDVTVALNQLFPTNGLSQHGLFKAAGQSQPQAQAQQQGLRQAPQIAPAALETQASLEPTEGPTQTQETGESLEAETPKVSTLRQ